MKSQFHECVSPKNLEPWSLLNQKLVDLRYKFEEVLK